MSELTIDECEELEDIEIALDKELKVVDIEKRLFYIPDERDCQKTILEKKETFSKYEIFVLDNGFLCENPEIVSLYENQEFSKEEISEIFKTIKLKFSEIYSKEMTIESSSSNKRFELLGINLKKQSTLDDSNDNFNLEKHTQTLIILYLQNSKNDIIRLVLEEQYGMCSSGYTTASWGIIYYTKCDKLPTNFCYKPKNSITVSLEEKISSTLNIIFIDNKTSEKIGKIICDFDGGDNYYPIGYIDDTLNFSKQEHGPDNDEYLSIYFDINNEYRNKIIYEEELMP